MLTKKDIDWLMDSLKETFLTKSEITKRLDWITEKIDWVAGEVKAMRESQELHMNQHDRIDARFDRLEKKFNLPPIMD